MYQKYWGLIAAPFQNVPDPNFFFLSAQHREGMARLMYAVKHNKGAALLTGDVGCGKTTLSRAFVVTLAQDSSTSGWSPTRPCPAPTSSRRSTFSSASRRPTPARWRCSAR
jgi:type II secretory pathway predicted ATPase ExeA